VSAAHHLSAPFLVDAPHAATYSLLGWDVWTASGPLAWVDVRAMGQRLDIVLAESRPDTALELAEVAEVAERSELDRSPSWTSRTRLLLGVDGACSASHDASPSLLHVRHVGVEVTTVPRDGADGTSLVAIEHGDVLVATTPSFLQDAPAALLAQIPMRTRRRRSLAGLADDLVRRVGGAAVGERAAVVVAQRVWPAGG
jgi:hypothetical protein